MAGPVASAPQPAASAPSPAVHPVVEAATSSAANTATPLPLVSSSALPPPQTTPIALAEVPAPASATACASTLPPPAPGVNQTAPVAVPTIPQETMQKTLSTSSPAAIATTACIVQETMRAFRPHPAPPTCTVITPHAVFQEEEQKVVVSPLPPVPPREAKKVPSAAAGSAGNWRNRYDLQPSPSSGAAQHYGSEPLATNAATSSTRWQWTSNAVINSPKPMSNWRKTYWQHVDVHRYVARRYFGAPPPLEQ
ncbi:hypothetical protein Q4I32_007019 [Leishmania shawi]|uniref:Uncharacterized protein n=1 Tax=Leishmania shawi TaxID=5680 RepID=A0AAW3BC92_9TRYP